MSAAPTAEAPDTPVEPVELNMTSDGYHAMLEKLAETIAASEPDVPMHKGQRAADMEMAEWWVTLFHAAGYVLTPRTIPEGAR